MKNKPGGSYQNETRRTDKDLIILSAEGDVEAFAELVKRKWQRVYRIAARVCGPAEAEDVTQVVFLRLWRHMCEFVESGNVDRWLAKVAVNRAIDTSRHVWRRLRLAELNNKGADLPPFEDALMSGEITRVFAAAADGLGERQRIAFVLREMEEFDTQEVAELMGVSKSTVRNLVSQARRGLRKALRDKFPEYSPLGPAGEAENE